MAQLISESKILSITSETASNYYNGDFLSYMLFSLPTALVDAPNIKHRSLALINAQIPVSFYIINYTNDTLKLTINSILYTITITRGNYNSTTLITELQSKILIATGETITITYSKITGLLTFSHLSKNFTINFSGSTINSVLGFSTTANSTSTSFVLVASYPLNLLGIKQLHIRSKSIISDNVSSSTSGSGRTTLIASIPVLSPAFGLITYTAPAEIKCSIANTTIDDLEIEILDAETNQLINFNNTNWAMTFLLTVEREIEIKPPIPEKIPFEEKQQTPILTYNEEQPSKKPTVSSELPFSKDIQELTFLQS